MSTWSHLANAKHIDLIIAHVKAHPAAWSAATEEAAYDAAANAFKAVFNAAWDAAHEAAWEAAYEAAWNAVNDAARFRTACGAARFAILALVVWDHAGGLMDSSAEQVNVLAILGDQAAILLYPAIKIMETTQELA